MEQATVEQIRQILLSAGPLPLKKATEVGDYDRKHAKLAEGLLMSGIPLDKVEVKASSVHGRGVFAKQIIRKEELITIYPAHYINIHPEILWIGDAN